MIGRLTMPLTGCLGHQQNASFAESKGTTHQNCVVLLSPVPGRGPPGPLRGCPLPWGGFGRGRACALRGCPLPLSTPPARGFAPGPPPLWRGGGCAACGRLVGRAPRALAGPPWTLPLPPRAACRGVPSGKLSPPSPRWGVGCPGGPVTALAGRTGPLRAVLAALRASFTENTSTEKNFRGKFRLN